MWLPHSEGATALGLYFWRRKGDSMLSVLPHVGWGSCLVREKDTAAILRINRRTLTGIILLVAMWCCGCREGETRVYAVSNVGPEKLASKSATESIQPSVAWVRSKEFSNGIGGGLYR